MIPIFRKARKKMAENNKPMKYVRYAVGEIILVVIGILIALSINNWNEEQKESVQEKILLEQLKEDYLSNLQQLDSKIATRKLIINSSKDLLTYFDNPKLATRDSVISKLSNLGLTVTYDPIDNDLLASGQISIIKNQKLKILLTKWSTDVIQVQEVEAIYLNRYHYLDVPLMNKIGIGRTVAKVLYQKISMMPNYLLNKDELTPYNFTESRFEPNVETLLNNMELEGIVSYSIGTNEVINAESYTLRKQIVEILDILNELLGTPE
jgi:hypothetical protein